MLAEVSNHIGEISQTLKQGFDAISSPPIEPLTLVIALIGAATGIASLGWQIHTSCAKLKILPAVAVRERSDPELASGSYQIYPLSSNFLSDPMELIERHLSPKKDRAGEYEIYAGMQIVNLSPFALDIADLGFSRDSDVLAKRVRVDSPFFKKIMGLERSVKQTKDGPVLKFPARLESRESCWILFDGFNWSQAREWHYDKAFVRTACGIVKTKDAKAVLEYCHSWNKSSR